MELENKPGAAALLPMVLFLVLFIGTGTTLAYSGVDMAFYALSPTVALLPAIIWALLQGKAALEKKITIFLVGVGEINLITMCMIFLLAGAFASVATAVGGVAATVNFGLSLVPPQCILPGLFIITAFISTAMGTSCGTIAAIAPIAVGVAGQTDISLPLLIGVVVGGSMFGDNLSIISDTTIAATRTQDCEMRDKFRMNLLIALPPCLVLLVILFLVGAGGQTVTHGDYQIIKVLPYMAILFMALAGINVFVVLMSGIIFCGIVGIFCTDGYTLLQWGKDIFKGFSGMSETMIFAMLVGGLGELIRYHGGLQSLLRWVEKCSHRNSGTVSSRAGECCIALLVGLVDLCTANNTVAIIMTGGLAKEIADRNGIDRRRSASILDTASCIVQGLVPWGAQLLIASSIAKISPLSIIPNIWYCMLLGGALLVSILLGRPRAPHA